MIFFRRSPKGKTEDFPESHSSFLESFTKEFLAVSDIFYISKKTKWGVFFFSFWREEEAWMGEHASMGGAWAGFESVFYHYWVKWRTDRQIGSLLSSPHTRFTRAPVPLGSTGKRIKLSIRLGSDSPRWITASWCFRWWSHYCVSPVRMGCFSFPRTVLAASRSLLCALGTPAG